MDIRVITSSAKPVWQLTCTRWREVHIALRLTEAQSFTIYLIYTEMTIWYGVSDSSEAIFLVLHDISMFFIFDSVEVCQSSFGNSVTIEDGKQFRWPASQTATQIVCSTLSSYWAICLSIYCLIYHKCHLSAVIYMKINYFFGIVQSAFFKCIYKHINFKKVNSVFKKE